MYIQQYTRHGYGQHSQFKLAASARVKSPLPNINTHARTNTRTHTTRHTHTHTGDKRPRYISLVFTKPHPQSPCSAARVRHMAALVPKPRTALPITNNYNTNPPHQDAGNIIDVLRPCCRRCCCASASSGSDVRTCARTHSHTQWCTRALTHAQWRRVRFDCIISSCRHAHTHMKWVLPANVVCASARAARASAHCMCVCAIQHLLEIIFRTRANMRTHTHTAVHTCE